MGSSLKHQDARALISAALFLLAMMPGVTSTASPKAPVETPCDPPRAGLDQPEVQVGFRREMHADTCLYIYTVLNRGREKLTKIQIGYDADLDRCELTGPPAHALPDTSYGRPGWDSGPVQMKKEDPSFTVQWVPTLTSIGSTGVLPNSSASGFTVALPRPDSLYEHCHWMIRFEKYTFMSYVGLVRPENELDMPSIETGTISGRVIDERGAGIPNASVFVWRTDLSARTNTHGDFSVLKVPVGGQSILVRARGFDPCNRANLRVTPHAITRVDLRLPSLEQPTLCAPYTTVAGRVTLPFPGDVMDTTGARYLARGEPLPPKPPRASGPHAFLRAWSEGQIDITYPGLGSDTLRKAFTATVSRYAESPELERLVRIAEETYPPIQAILPIADSRNRDAVSKQERPWSYGEFDGVRLPYAVTMDAVRYYLALIQALARGDSTQTHGIRMKVASFTYRATVSQHYADYSRDGRAFKDVYVVSMKVRWSDYCGRLCACGFDLDREVVVRRDGTVLCVFGDRKPMVTVS